jgi:hypothetical protein
MKSWALLCAACAVWMIPATAVASPKHAHRNSAATLSLNSYHNWDRHYTPPVSASGDLARNQYEVATVSGTISYYAAINYRVPQRPWTVVCGTPERSALYPGPSGAHGPVGFDAEFIFARPWTQRECAQAHLPVVWPNFQMNDGTGWRHPNILGTVPVAPAANHTYSFAAVGHSDRLRFRLVDIYTRDNYGVLKISLRPATAADCSSYQAFDFTSSAACTAALG